MGKHVRLHHQQVPLGQVLCLPAIRQQRARQEQPEERPPLLHVQGVALAGPELQVLIDFPDVVEHCITTLARFGAGDKVWG